MLQNSWKQLFETALLETNDIRLQNCIRDAEIAINARRESLEDSTEDLAEWNATEEALRMLNAIKHERVGWRRYGT